MTSSLSRGLTRRPASALLVAIVLAFAAACGGPPSAPDSRAADTVADSLPSGGAAQAPAAVAAQPSGVALASTASGPVAAASSQPTTDLPVPPAPNCPPPQPGPWPPPVRVRQTAPPAIGAAAAVVIDAGSGAVLWGHNEHEPLQPASTTKIVTALLALERGNMDDVITARSEDRRFNVGTRMGLVTGDAFTLRDLLYGMMLPSGNDASIVIAEHFAGSDAAFAGLMNQRMCELGLVDSTFINSSGLGRGEYNMASAHDLAQVTRHAFAIPAFAELARTRWWTARGSRTLSMRNLNELLGSYAGADGVKIGWTPSAGHTIVASATRNGHRVIVALLRTPNRAGESAALLDWAFSSFVWE